MVFSLEPGFYEETQFLQIIADEAEVEIYYTTDGSDPLENGILYEGSIELAPREGDENIFSEIPTNNIPAGHIYREEWQSPQGEVFKIHVIRAVAIGNSGDLGEETAGSFIVEELGANRYSFPLFSVITDPDNFFGCEKGIYVPGRTGGNYFQRGREWEREVHLEFFETDGSRVLAQNAGARIHGGASRNRPRKTLRLYAREEYGNSWFDYAFFESKNVNRYKRFLLRNSGNDWNESLFREGFIQRLIIRNTELDAQHTRPAIVFINGEYWGIHNIRDRYDERYLQTHYNLPRDRVTILEGDIELDDGNPEGIADFQELYDYVVAEDMNATENFEWVEDRMDIDNFIDYYIIQIYCRNTDWPGNNLAYWKYLDGEPSNSLRGHDGRWRWLLFDLDFGFGLDFDYVRISGQPHGPNDASHNTLAFVLDANGSDWPNPPWSTALFRNLMENREFEHRFVNRFADHLNTSFKVEQVLEVLDQFKNWYEPEMHDHRLRWIEPPDWRWENDIKRMRTFGTLRESSLQSHLNTTLDLGGKATITLDVNEVDGGTIGLNSIVLRKSLDGVDEDVFPWMGTYFKTVPVTLVALPEAGYEFSHWSGDVNSLSDTLEILPEEGMEMVVHFKRGNSFEGDSMNPIALKISEEDFRFDFWNSAEPEGSFPANMVFQQSRVSDPGPLTAMTHPYHIPFVSESDNEYHSNDQDKFGFPYSLTGRSRIEGLGGDGIAFINTGRDRDLGMAVLALNTENVERVLIDWEAETLEENSRVYSLKLQYRIGLQGVWRDVLDESGEPVEYLRDEGIEMFYDIPLPEDALDQNYVQLGWRYYFTGIRLDDDSGRRDKLRLDNIFVRMDTGSNTESNSEMGVEFHPLHPNPADRVFEVSFHLPNSEKVVFYAYDQLGKPIFSKVLSNTAPGHNQFLVDSSSLNPGIYLIVMEVGGQVFFQRLAVVR